jgi:PHP family Zn ribbon phosphoesterase
MELQALATELRESERFKDLSDAEVLKNLNTCTDCGGPIVKQKVLTRLIDLADDRDMFTRLFNAYLDHH